LTTARYALGAWRKAGSQSPWPSPMPIESWSLSAGIASTIRQTRRPNWGMPLTSGLTAIRSTVATHGTGRAPQGVRRYKLPASANSGNRPAGDEREGEREDKPRRRDPASRYRGAKLRASTEFQAARVMGAVRPTHTPQTQPISWFPSVSTAIRALPLGSSQIRQFVSSTAGTPLRTAAGRSRGSSAARIATVAPSRARRESSKR
jgi:hypothetical protein